MTVANSETPQESLVCDFDCRLPESQDTFYLKVEGIISSSKKTITKKIDSFSYDKSNLGDRDKW